MRRLLAVFALAGAVVLSALLTGGCSSLKHMAPVNDPPHTIIFVSGPLDTVTHTVHLHWFGTDAHGYIIGYEVRMLNPLQPADTAWRFTLTTDSVITVFTPTGYVSPVFEARAIDDQGVRDPHPARQTFQFNNLPPIVKLVGKPNAADHSDSTFASATVTWSVDDPDGNSAAVVCRVWLDGQAADPLLAPGNKFTMPSSRFLNAGQFTAGRRTLYIQGVDDGGMAGPIDSVTWYVKSPSDAGRARLLLIDDTPTADPNSPTPAEVRVDTLYNNAITRSSLTPGSYRILRLQRNQPFRSAKDLEQTMKQFETVVWYRGEQTLFSAVLDSFAVGAQGEGIGPYLDSGGKLYIESLNLVEAWSSYGPLKQSFIKRYLDCDGTFQRAQVPDSTGSWGAPTTGTFILPGVADSIPSRRTIGGLRAFVPRSNSEILMTAPAHMLSPDNPIPMPVAMNVGQPGGGQFIAMTYPLVTGTVGANQRASIVLYKIFGLLGLN